MTQIDLKDEEALVLHAFLRRFRDKNEIDFEHDAEKHVLFDLCVLIEHEIGHSHLLDNPDSLSQLKQARDLLASDDYE